VPPCKYLHPPQHLKDQLLQNGRNNLIMKHIQMQALVNGVSGMYPVVSVVLFLSLTFIYPHPLVIISTPPHPHTPTPTLLITYKYLQLVCP